MPISGNRSLSMPLVLSSTSIDTLPPGSPILLDSPLPRSAYSPLPTSSISPRGRTPSPPLAFAASTSTDHESIRAVCEERAKAKEVSLHKKQTLAIWPLNYTSRSFCILLQALDDLDNNITIVDMGDGQWVKFVKGDYKLLHSFAEKLSDNYCG